MADLNVKDFDKISSWCKQKEINLVVVGPEDPLANGMDFTGIACA